MKIFIKSHSTYAVDVQASDKIISIKQQIYKIEGVVIEEQCLYFETASLIDHHKIEDYNIESGSTLHLNLRLLGGVISE